MKRAMSLLLVTIFVIGVSYWFKQVCPSAACNAVSGVVADVKADGNQSVYFTLLGQRTVFKIAYLPNAVTSGKILKKQLVGKHVSISYYLRRLALSTKTEKLITEIKENERTLFSETGSK